MVRERLLGSQLHGKNLAACSSLDLAGGQSSLEMCDHGLSGFRGYGKYLLFDRGFAFPASGSAGQHTGIFETETFPYTGRHGIELERIFDNSVDPYDREDPWANGDCGQFNANWMKPNCLFDEEIIGDGNGGQPFNFEDCLSDGTECEGDLKCEFLGPDEEPHFYVCEYGYYSRKPVEVTRPTVCSAGERLPAAIVRNESSCEGAASALRALAMACQIRRDFNVTTGTQPPPAIAEVSDIPKLEAWVDAQARNARVAASRMVLRDVPSRVVDEIMSGNAGGQGVLTGDHGELVLEYANQARAIASGWRTVESGFADISGQIRTANIALEGLDIREDQAIKQLALSSLSARTQLLQSYVNAAASVGGVMSNPFGPAAAAANAVITEDFYSKQQSIIGQLRSLSGNEKANQVAQVLSNLSEGSRGAHERIETALDTIRQGVTDARQVAIQLNRSSNKAKYAAAKGSGADYVIIDGEAVKFPVNTVQNRLYESTHRRYEEALRRAKYLSYVARLAIEQRIGFRLADMDTPVVTVHGPSTV